MKRLFLLFVFGIMLYSCARVGSPVGGAKDTIAPNFLGSNIDSPRTNVPRNIKELRLEFDEYITLKDIQKNLVVSPPIKIKKILPANLATKYVSIQWEDTLQANTTYNFNFGNAIQDNNEGNPLRYFNFAFSTGDKIDDLYISGEVKDALQVKKTTDKKNRVVGLYKETEPIDYRQKPYYITNVDDDGYFELNYLAPGKYRIVAFEDDNGNSVYDPGKEKIGFLKEPINLEKSVSGLDINLFPSKKQVRYKEWKEVPGGVLLVFEGNPEDVEISSLNEKLQEYKVTHRKFSDSVNVWFDAQKQNVGTNASETLRFSYKTAAKHDTIPLTAYRYNTKNEMVIENQDGSVLPPGRDFRFVSNYFIQNIDPEKWTLMVDSTTAVPFSARISEENPLHVWVKADFKEGKKYQFTVPKGTVSSFYASNSVGKRFDFEAALIQNYGSFTLRLANKPDYNFWIQLVNSEDKVLYSRYTREAETKFPMVKPGEYIVKILVDNNGNGHWDEADFGKGIFAEDGYIYHKILSIRPLWESVEDWDMADKSTIGLKPGASFSEQKTPASSNKPNAPKRDRNEPLEIKK